MALKETKLYKDLLLTYSFVFKQVFILFNPLAGKYPERDPYSVPNFPSQVTNYQV